jgi:uncharacterized protein YciI
MEMIQMRTLGIFILLSLTLSPISFANDCPSPMTGENKIAVSYFQGKNWAQFSAYRQDHLGFLAKQMLAGNIQYGGPFTAKQGDVVGLRDAVGLAIYNSADFAHVEPLVKEDALVRNDVVRYEMISWLQCSIIVEPAK